MSHSKILPDVFPVAQTIVSKGRILSLIEPIVMGIINITPDSFYSASQKNKDTVIDTAQLMLQQGAAILDLGGASSRPGSVQPTAQEEMDRILPVIEKVRAEFPDSWLSVDTFRASVAREAINIGADIVNDISAGHMDPDMLDFVAQLNVPYIAMHMQGTPENMQSQTNYPNGVTDELVIYFLEVIHQCRQRQIKDIIIDPGFGFGKSIDQNYELLNRIDEFKFLGKPMLVGLSRKKMIYEYLGNTPQDALNGTTVLNMVALQKGAKILRVHDVKEAVETVKIYKKLKNHLPSQ